MLGGSIRNLVECKTSSGTTGPPDRATQGSLAQSFLVSGGGRQATHLGGVLRTSDGQRVQAIPIIAASFAESSQLNRRSFLEEASSQFRRSFFAVSSEFLRSFFAVVVAASSQFRRSFFAVFVAVSSQLLRSFVAASSQFL